MSDELIPMGELGVAKFADEKTFEALSSNAFLPRLQLMGSSSTAVKEGKISQGHYGLVRGKDQVEDLTKETNVIVLSWRPKALEIKESSVVSVYDPKSPEFKRITEKSEEPDSGCMFGPEFLVWVPSHRTFATVYMSSKTARREAPVVRGLMGKAATLKAQLIKAKKFAWHGMVVTPCSQPLDLPDLAQAKEETAKFNNPPSEETEAVPDTGERVV